MHITARGIDTQYQRIGKGKVIILLHGWGCDWQIWAPIIGPLSDHYQLIIPDLPAFGQSAIPSQVWDTKEFVAWLNEFIEQIIGTQPFILIGHSFGGKIAAVFAAEYQNSVLSKLVLVDSSGLPDPLSMKVSLQRQILGLIPERFKQGVSVRLKQKLLAATGSSTDHFYSTPAQRKIFKKIIDENIKDDLLKITVPTLLVWGKKDTDTPVHQGQKFATLIPHSTLVIFNDAGHFPFVDESQAFVNQVQSFFKAKHD